MRQLFYVQAINEAFREEMRRDERVFIYGEDVRLAPFTITLGLLEEFGPDRVRNTPISEALMAGLAVGAAALGMRPIVDMTISSFMYLAMDQLANQAAKMTYMSGGTVTVPLVMRAPVGATSRGAQHAQSLEAFFTHIPGLKVVAPSTAYDAKGLLKSAVRDDNPVLIFEHKLLYGSKGPRSERGAISPIGEVPDEEYLVPIGEGVIRREGRDVTIVGKLLTVYRALGAAEQLAQEGIEAEVIDPRTLVPLDKELILESVRKTGRLVIVEEDNLTGGWAADIAAIVAEEAFFWLDAPIKRVSAPDTPVPFAPVMEQFYVPSEERVIEAVKSLF